MGAFWTLAAYCLLIALASYCGGWLPSLVKLTHTSMQTAMSFVGGLMLGVALLHLAPHSIVQTGSTDLTMGFAVVGLVSMFLLIRAFNVHQHGVDDLQPGHHRQHEHAGHDHHHHHDHLHDAPEMCPQPGHRHRLSWFGLAIGFSLHTIIDGIALSASVAAESAHTPDFWLAGLGTFLAVALHKPFDALSITSVMALGGWTPAWRRLVNGAFALMCPLGAVAFYFGAQEFAGRQSLVLGCALGFACGVFLCIALADLLPEIQFHSHDRLLLSAALVAGVAMAYLIGLLEPAHSHSAPAGAPVHEPAAAHSHDHEHDHPHDDGRDHADHRR